MKEKRALIRTRLKKICDSYGVNGQARTMVPSPSQLDQVNSDSIEF